MRARSRVVVWSLLGAVAVHGAFIACGQVKMDGTGPMASLVSDVRDAAVNAIGLEMGDARADDASTGPACSCPVPPAPAETTFSLTINQGHGAVSPMSDYSTAVVTARPALTNNLPTIYLGSTATFFMADGQTSYRLECSATIAPNKTQLTATNCSLFVSAVDARNCHSDATNLSYVVAELSDHSVEWSIPSAMFGPATCQTGTAPSTSTSINGIVFRANDPSARFLTPPRAYRP